jgi:hypothetical protein
MNVSPYWVAAVLVAGTIAATAAPVIPSSELPGRERDRFTESPVERFMRPGPYVAPPVVNRAAPNCGASKHHSKLRSSRQRNC